MTDSDKGYILAGLDGSDLCDSVIKHAIWVSQCNQHPIKFFHVIEHTHKSENVRHEGTLTPGIHSQLLKKLSEEEREQSKKLLAEGKRILQDAREQAEAAGLTNFVTGQRHSTLPEALSDLEPETALVILGCKGESHNGDKKGLGSQLEASIKAIHTPIFIVKEAFETPKKLMFAYNGSETSKKALQMVRNYRFCYENLEIHVVYVEKDIATAKTLLARAKKVFKEADIEITAQTLTGEPLEELMNYQQENDIDITAMGAFSHGKFHHFFFGSFTTQMLLKNGTHFLIVR